ncbi:MAG: hypothetical protein KatS3mg124_0953 [Porticoccaceae bacterium]|nr:MAG: hypothetical protein KatS3mg124_0953 [Porticoccaceae bacterium]
MPWNVLDERWLWALGLLSLAVFAASALALPWVAAAIPQDYFRPRRRRAAPWRNRHPLLRFLFLLLKNLLGLVLLAGGVLMLFLPGQGLLTLLAGLILLDYPGKFALERWLVSHRPVLTALNWLRRRRGAPPLVVD